ncbi:MAG TPA: hypothetical protein VLA46_08025 [Saprospiraceae bacterium]|nr:hypothetical protein [Saprospiraceae bacterium]
MIIRFVLFSLAFVYYASISAQQYTPEQLGWKQFSINHQETGAINYYVTLNTIRQEKPILLYLDGSGSYPLYQYTERGIGSSVPLDYQKLSEDFHIIIISKPGVPFIDTVATDSLTGYPLYETPAEYIRRLSLDWRVTAAEMVLKDAIKNLPEDKSKIAVLGISEGFQVGAKLIAGNKKITHAVLMVGNGLSQFYDFIIQNRLDAQTGALDAAQAQENIDSLNATFRDIYANSKSTERNWYGHTYLRWSSFSQSNPTDNILSTNIPVYIVACANDRNTSVLGTDYLYLESIRRGKTNITYNVYPYDHMFNEVIRDDQGQVISVNHRMKEVMDSALLWIKEK